jgi:GT2 family glycosyltransferase
MTVVSNFDPPEPSLAVIIPTHNRWEEARETLAQLQKSDYRNFEIVLIEDGCTDGTADNCQREFPDVHLLHGDGSLWWSGAINKGVEYALARGADAIVWLNDDNRVEPDTLSRMVESFKRTGERSIICARTKSTDTGLDEWVGDPPRWHPEFGKWQPPDLFQEDVPVKHPPGGRGVLIPAACFREIGLVDSQAFPHYWADHDFHYRAMEAGYRYFIASKTAVWNVPNKLRPEATELFSSAGAHWFLFNRRSAMNMPTVRRLLKRHLTQSEYRRIFYPILFRHLVWLSYGWLTQTPWLHKPLRKVKESVVRGKAPDAQDR